MITKEIWAKAGLLKFPGPDGATVLPFWGFAASADEEPQLPGPLIEARQGDTLQVVLHNGLPEPVSLVFPGQDMVPDPVKDDSGRFVSYARPAEPDGGSYTYSLTLNRPGTFMYESGFLPELQVPMGLSGALVVRPADYYPAIQARKTAYGPGTGSEFAVEQVILLGEMDSRLNRALAAGQPFDPTQYTPDFHMINGRTFPATILPDDAGSQPYGSRVSVLAGGRVLLRCLNAGSLVHLLHVSCGHFRVLAGNASPLQTVALDTTCLGHTLNIGPGKTYDLVLTADRPGQTYLFDRSLKHSVQEGNSPGGMITRIDALASIPDAPPPVPSSLVCTAVAADMVELAWEETSPSADGLVLGRKTGLAGLYTELVVLLGPRLAGYQDRTVSPETTYVYRIRTFNTAGYSAFSGEVGTTTPPTGLAQELLTLEAQVVTGQRVNLSWVAGTGDWVGFWVERRAGEGAFVRIATLGPDQTSFSDTSVAPNTTYIYRVQAQTISGYSNEATATTPMALPEAPSHLVAHQYPGNRVHLRWVDRSDNEDRFVIERQGWWDHGFVKIAILEASSTDYVDSNVNPGSNYYRVKAMNSAGSSPYSNVARVMVD